MRIHEALAEREASVKAPAFSTTDAVEPGHEGMVTSSLAYPVAAPADGRVRVGSGEIPSFERIYEELFDFVWRSARRLGVIESAVDDVVQDTFVVVHRRLADFEQRSTLKTWVFAILMRVVADHRRTLRRKGGLATLPDDEVLGDPGTGPVEALEHRQAARLLHALLDELDDEKRTVFVLAELEELGAPEIAELLAIPVNTVYSRLRAAREAFEKALGRHRAGERARAARIRSKP